MTKFLLLCGTLFLCPVLSHALGTSTATITNLTLVNNNTQIQITVQVSGGQTFVLPALAFDPSDTLTSEQKVIRYIQGYLDTFNNKSLNDFANDLKAITFSSSGLPPE